MKEFLIDLRYSIRCLMCPIEPGMTVDSRVVHPIAISHLDDHPKKDLLVKPNTILDREYTLEAHFLCPLTLQS